ncbi:hypothetical protein PF005_g19493 [Phytophthora fragariae]|uniref:Uncharacterized protein n=1 Tax=Phytophthora fragariae TaxID=53985 RepID=A0A6A3R673_9STRA|nr:hypothetical protein PF003_g12946 [Phytophthora fragariae]KAE8928899.1 hypothetical protein PF009_g20974 [Phytophthora fragariae]KAE8987698.1 hypothetical protein PF011_g19476 [Phytophthora fragariae]KAE9087449.1 hypothetical protein PF007_g20371 [Phytophthora fragariae]KAE9087810.1 hypothetical protein PF010_g19589 [Phytophthora fragariae]
MGRQKPQDRQVVGGKRRFVTLRNLRIISEHVRLGSTYSEPGKKHSVQGNQMKRCVAKKDGVQAAGQRSIHALTVHPGKDPPTQLWKRDASTTCAHFA